MNHVARFLSFVLSLLLLSHIPATVASDSDYQPQFGQSGKDVIWVPTPEEQAEAMLDLAGVTSADYVIDLGSGDGRIVIAAALRGATALGIEYNPDMVDLSRKKAEQAGVTDKASFVQADLFESDFSKASVITMYLLPDLNLKLRPKILDLEPGTRIVSHAFSMGEWEPDASEMDGGRNLYMWVVPSKVQGEWTWMEDSGPVTLNLKQTFQAIEGVVASSRNIGTISEAALRGDQIAFTWGERYYSGKISQNQIRGKVRSPDGESEWVAARKFHSGR